MKVSIALATYNGSSFLREQLDSVLAQSFQDFELVIGDDCSTDDTPSVLQEYIAKDSRIQFFKNEKNLGFKKNFEKIISYCSGEFIAFCDQDDIWTTNHLETLLKNIGNHDCIGANALIIDENGISQNKTLLEYWPVHYMPHNAEELFIHELYSNVIQGTASMVRKSLIKDSLPIPKNVKYHHYWFALNAGLHNGCKYIPDVILHYRRHSKNVSAYQKFSIIQAIKDLWKISKNRKNFYQDNINIIENLSLKEMSEEKRLLLNKALCFFQNLSDNKHRWSLVKHYIKNYNTITFSRKKVWLLYTYRLLGLIIFGIKG